MGNSGTLAGLQAVRLGAALSVLVFHAVMYAIIFKVFDGDLATDVPYILAQGVQVFFFLSGFLMAKISDEMPLGRFVTHRILRIFPTYWCAIAIAMFIEWMPHGNIPEIDWRAFLLLPVGPSEYVLRVEWTLIFEVFYYAVTALLCLIPFKIARRILVFIWFVAVLYFHRGQAATYPTVSEIALSLGNVPFIVGMLTWWCVGPRLDKPAVLISAAAVLSFLTWFEALTAVTLVSALLVLGAATRRAGKIATKVPFLLKGGDASFGIYLLHVPVQMVFYLMTPLRGWTAIVAGITISLLLGTLFGLIEHRCYELLRRRVDRYFHKPDSAALRPASAPIRLLHS